MARFNQMDKDQNGKISKDEAEGRFAENFDAFDADADGNVTKEEFSAARAKLGGGRGGRPRNAEASGN
jgi:Ca2+-binding EF-hand superfamily protein